MSEAQDLAELQAELEKLEVERDELLKRDRDTWISLGEPPAEPETITAEEQERLDELQKELIPALKEEIQQFRGQD